MPIHIKTSLFLGYIFSDICKVIPEKNEVDFFSEKMESEIKSRFIDKEIHIEEITPELIALITDLEYSYLPDNKDYKEGVIGVKLICQPTEDMNFARYLNLNDLTYNQSIIIAKMKNLDPEITTEKRMHIVMAQNVKVEGE